MSDFSLEIGRSGVGPSSPRRGTRSPSLVDTRLDQGPPLITLSRDQIRGILQDKLRGLLDEALARYTDRDTQRDTQDVQAIVEEVVNARREELRGLAGRDGHDALQGNSH